ncbi:cytosine permease [Curtobacterium flaccumfaciens]|uniref:purine-cytosine permease family protein n=1 Tax=Curtobacterium flaccumfaciens TaxID=2035 RepID=UPI00188C61D9|nr:cytosine permease [Curtobacterium flaccumfaciens]MBF4595605.1 cytosine permease [Curtobacterium flaccumfaciens]
MATELRTDALGVESHTIDHIPEDERHGKARNLFTIWFGGQIMMLTIATGLLATVVYGLPVWAALLAMAIGNVAGGVVMALHAAQGPQMGVPQMLQTRAQFGSYGSLLVVVIVVGMYVAFFSSNIVLGGQALNSLVHIGSGVSTILIGLVSVVGAVFGYRLLHAFGTVMSFVAGGTLLLVFVWVFLVHGLPAATFSTGAITPAGFMATVSLAALWQIAYAPYVSDYSRYMPKDTGVRAAFWATFSGAVVGSFLAMSLGALVGAAMPKLDTAAGLTALTPGISGIAVLVFGVGISISNSMNLYCGSLSVITIGQTLFPRWQPRAGTRAVIALVLFGIALVLGLAFADDFLVSLSNFMILLLCVLIPWTAINLVDYYLLRHGDYDIASLFRRDGGVYGRVNVVAVVCYLVGIAIQIPFVATAFYSGPVAVALGGVDISWIVGLAVICPLYYLLMKRSMVSRSAAVEPRIVAPVAFRGTE